jgi:hypothetical protein
MHADDGFCAAIRKAKLVVLVQNRIGNIVQNYYYEEKKSRNSRHLLENRAHLLCSQKSNLLRIQSKIETHLLKAKTILLQEDRYNSYFF